MLNKLKKIPSRAKSRQLSPDGAMTLSEHINELRARIIISLAWISAFLVFCFYWYQNPVSNFPSLGEIVSGPYCDLPSNVRVELGTTGECKLLATSPMEMFMLRLKVSTLAALLFSSPFWLFQVWAYISPGLLRNEAKWTLSFVISAVSLFILGTFLAYNTLQFGLQFLMSIGSEVQATVLTGHEYFKFMLALMLGFGLAFELPLILVFLNLAGALHYRHIARRRRAVWILVFITGAVLTPGGDPYSMLMLAVPLGVMLELSFLFCLLNDRSKLVRKAEKAAAPVGLDVENLKGVRAMEPRQPDDLFTEDPLVAGTGNLLIESSTEHVRATDPPSSRSAARPIVGPSHSGNGESTELSRDNSSSNLGSHNPSIYRDVL